MPKSFPSLSKSPFDDVLLEASADTPKALSLAAALLAPDVLSREAAGPSPASVKGGTSCRRQLVLTDDTASEAASLLALEAPPSRDNLNAANMIFLKESVHMAGFLHILFPMNLAELFSVRVYHKLHTKHTHTNTRTHTHAQTHTHTNPRICSLCEPVKTFTSVSHQL